MATPLINPEAVTYATRQPYATAWEFNAYPTGIDSKRLITGGSTQQNTEALAAVLRAASEYVDTQISMTAAATVDTHYSTYRLRADATIAVILPHRPVVQVLDVAIGDAPVTVASLTDLTGCWLEGRVLHVPTSYVLGWGLAPDPVFAQVKYVNGWANASLTVAPAAGSTSLSVSSGLGFVPGQTIGLRSSTGSEAVVIASTYVPTTAPGPAVLPLTAPTQNAYAVGDVATCLPASIKTATILLAVCMIRARGDSAIVMGSVHDQPSTTERLEDAAPSEYGMALDLLSDFRRAYM